MKDKVSYEIDPHNRLTVKSTPKKSNVKKFRRVLCGRFRTDTKNRLYYEVYKSRDTEIPQKIELSGKYSLDRNHGLVFALSRWDRQRENGDLRLRAKITGIAGREIVFLVGTKTSGGKRAFYTLVLNGAWKADKNNRLTFGVKKEDGKTDTLTFFNSWCINKNNEIEYNFGKGHSVALKGKWEIKNKYEIKYILDKKINSGFDFSASLGRLIPKGKEAYIKFEVTINLAGQKGIKRNVIFNCRYKPGKGRSVILEASPGTKRINIKLTREIMGQKGLIYLESFLKDREKYIGGGMAFRW